MITNILIVILLATLVLWSVVRIITDVLVFRAFVSPEHRDIRRYAHWYNRTGRYKKYFNFIDIKNDWKMIRMSRDLNNMSEEEFDALLPTPEQTVEIRDAIIEEFGKALKAAPDYFDASISPLWAIVYIYTPPDHPSVQGVFADFEFPDQINLSKEFARTRDRVTKEICMKYPAKLEGWFMDGPVYFQAAKMLRLTNMLATNEVKLQYIRDLTNPLRKHEVSSHEPNS